MKHIFSALILVIAVIYCGLPLIRSGYIPTHDGEYHIIRFHEFSKMLSSGYLFPRWAAGLNSGYGIPLFNFHYPFPNYIGSLYHILGLSLSDAFKLTLFTGYVSAVFFCYLWLSKLFDKKAAVVGALVCSFTPYLFVDLYVRGSVGEIFAISFFILALAAIEHSRLFFLALALGGMILSHNILAMVFLPILVLYICIRGKHRHSIYLLFGLGIAAYFWVPALAERHLVTGLSPVRFGDHFPDLVQLLFPSWGTGFSAPGMAADEMSQQIGIMPLLLFLLTTVVGIREKNRNIRITVWFFLFLAVAAGILLHENSMQLWTLLPFFGYIQYPWRLLSIVPVATGFFAAYWAWKVPHALIKITVVGIAFFFISGYIRPVVYEKRNDEYYLSKREFTDGTSSLGNSFSTIWSPWKTQRASSLISVIPDSAVVDVKILKPLHYSFSLASTVSGVLQINTLYYPGWELQSNGTRIPFELQEGLPRIAFEVGTHEFSFIFKETPLRITAGYVSLISLFWLIGSAILNNSHENRDRYNSIGRRS